MPSDFGRLTGGPAQAPAAERHRRHLRIGCPMTVRRAAVVTCLVLGIAFAGPGAALAQTGSAGRAQYVPPRGQVLPSGGAGQVQAGAQAGIHERPGGLPFTGLAVIPVLLGGALLLATGLALRHRIRED